MIKLKKQAQQERTGRAVNGIGRYRDLVLESDQTFFSYNLTFSDYALSPLYNTVLYFPSFTRLLSKSTTSTLSSVSAFCASMKLGEVHV